MCKNKFIIDLEDEQESKEYLNIDKYLYNDYDDIFNYYNTKDEKNNLDNVYSIYEYEEIIKNINK